MFLMFCLAQNLSTRLKLSLRSLLQIREDRDFSGQQLEDGVSYVSTSSDGDSDCPKRRRRYRLRATKPGFHYIGEPGKSPMVWVGPGTSSFGYLTSAQNLESPFNNKAAKYNTQNGDSKSNKLEDERGEDHGEETEEENEAETSYF
ncbi:hypothetical protein V2W45_1371480 [Cenococcum geophilum]